MNPFRKLMIYLILIMIILLIHFRLDDQLHFKFYYLFWFTLRNPFLFFLTQFSFFLYLKNSKLHIYHPFFMYEFNLQQVCCNYISLKQYFYSELCEFICNQVLYAPFYDNNGNIIWSLQMKDWYHLLINKTFPIKLNKKI